MHSKSDSKAFKTYENVNDIVDELFKARLSRYQSGFELSMRGWDFIFDSVQLLY